MSAPPAGTASISQSFLSTRRGALILALLLLVQFLDFLDVSIVNVALPSIKHDLAFSQESLQWVVSGYVLTYGGFLLLGGRAAVGQYVATHHPLQAFLGEREIVFDRGKRHVDDRHVEEIEELHQQEQRERERSAARGKERG